MSFTSKSPDPMSIMLQWVIFGLKSYLGAKHPL